MKKVMLKITSLCVMALSCLSLHAEGTAAPDMLITFADSLVGRTVEIGIGGTSSFKMDWGDGVMKDYEGADYFSGTLQSTTLKVYGDGIMILFADNCDVTGIVINNEPSMSKILANNNHLSTIEVSMCPLLRGLYLSGNELMQVTLGDENKAGAVVVDLSRNRLSGALDVSKWTNISQIDVSCNELTRLTLPTDNDVLYKVICDSNRISELDLHGCTKLDYVSANANELTAINLEGDNSVTEIFVGDNRLATLDVSACQSLKTLTANGNYLTAIDLAANLYLEGVYLYDNQLAGLDLGNNKKVRWLNVENNRLRALDTGSLRDLSLLLASNNELESVDLSANTRLQQVKLGSNRLTEFPPFGAEYLSWLKLDNNRLTSISLEGYPYLYWLELGNNSLSDIDVTKNTNLQWLAVEDNRLGGLDITRNAGLQGLSLHGNLLDKQQIDGVISALPDVSDVEVNYNNKAFARKLNISNMPGTSSADVASALAKGWEVTADVADGIRPAGVRPEVSADAYDLRGMKVGDYYKGVVVSNGKKVVR